MKWTYQEYMAQPEWFIKNIVMTITQENHLKNLLSKQKNG